MLCDTIGQSGNQQLRGCKQHGETRPLIVGAAANAKLSIDRADKRSNDAHAETCALGGVEPFRQSRPFVFD